MNKIAAGLFACMMLCISSAACARPVDGNGPVTRDFKLQDLSGKTHQLSAYWKKQPVLLFFWTTWCPFCLKELQVLNSRDYAALVKDGVTLLSINAGERRQSVERLVRNYSIVFTVLLDEDSAVTDDYRVVGVPTFVLIDKKGSIRYQGNGYPRDEIQQVIEE
jgi:cytochrome c biogenesis protein CcmG, thiol:disulfide interchange protein DsbE